MPSVLWPKITAVKRGSSSQYLFNNTVHTRPHNLTLLERHWSSLLTNASATGWLCILEPSSRVFVKQCRTINLFSVSGDVSCPGVLSSVGVSMGMMKACETALWLLPDILHWINYLWSLNNPRLGSMYKAKVHFLLPTAVWAAAQNQQMSLLFLGCPRF